MAVKIAVVEEAAEVAVVMIEVIEAIEVDDKAISKSVVEVHLMEETNLNSKAKAEEPMSALNLLAQAEDEEEKSK